MITDALINLVPPQLGGLPIVGGSVPSPNLIDLLGVGVGQAPPSIIGTASTFGSDYGIGEFRPEIDVCIGTSFQTGTSATLNIQLQGAPDTGQGGGYLPGTWTTIAETGPIDVANLTSGSHPARWPILPFPVVPLPRYLRVNFVVGTGTFTGGTIGYVIVTTIRDDQSNKYAASNYVALGS